MQALSLDQPSVALPVLEHSPLLIDADLVDIIATGNCEMQCAIARRINLPASVCAAIAEVGTAAAALELIENAYAELAPFSWDRIVERHGHLAAIRESMLVLEDLPAATRVALVAKLSDTLAQFVVARNWLSADRAVRIASEARDRSTVNIAARSRGDDMRGLVRHLRATGQLTAGLILRALLSGNLELFDHALAELSGLPQARVSALLHDRGGASLQALLERAGLPESTFAAFRVALEVSHETGFVDTLGGRGEIAAPHGRTRADALRDRPASRRAALDPAAALCDRIGAGRSPHVLRRADGRGGRRADPARADRGLSCIVRHCNASSGAPSAANASSDRSLQPSCRSRVERRIPRPASRTRMTCGASIRRHDARGEDGFEVLGAVAVGVGEVLVGDAAQLPAQFAGHADGVELGALAHDRLNGVDVMRDQVGRHLVEIGRVLDDPAQALGGGARGRVSEGGGVALDVMGGAKQFFARGVR